MNEAKAMKSDLIPRLRAFKMATDPDFAIHPAICDEAADELARLEYLQNERDFLRSIGDRFFSAIVTRNARNDGATLLDFMQVWLEQARDAERKARAALPPSVQP